MIGMSVIIIIGYGDIIFKFYFKGVGWLMRIIGF